MKIQFLKVDDFNVIYVRFMHDLYTIYTNDLIKSVKI